MTISFAAQWWTERMNQPKDTSVLMYCTVAHAPSGDGR